MDVLRIWTIGFIELSMVILAVSNNLPVESSYGLDVRCNPVSMDLIIDRARFFYLDPRTFHFNGTKCYATYVNSTHVIMRTPLGGCKTRYTSDEDLITFSNVVDTEVFNKGSPISRYPSHLFMFECSYYTTFEMTLNAFSTVGKIITKPKMKMGNFSFTMDMFQTNKYYSPYTSFPVRVRLGERIFLQVKVQTNATGLTLFLDRCKATPSPDPKDEVMHYVLRNGCPTEETLNYKSSIDTRQRFSFQAFRFTSKPTTEVFLHCTVIVCHKDNNASRCHQACPDSNKPRFLTKRDITTRESEPDESQTYQNLTDTLKELINMTTKLYDVSLGPMKVYIDPVRGPPRAQEIEKAPRSRGSNHSIEPVFLVLACLILLYISTSQR